MSEKELSLQLISETIKAIDKVGTATVLEAVRDVQRVTKTDKELIDTILQTCCNYYKLNKHSLFEGTSRKDKRSEATIVCFILVKKYANYNNQQISDYFGKHKSLVSRYIKRFNNLDKKILRESELLSEYSDIESQTEKLITKFIKNGRTTN